MWAVSAIAGTVASIAAVTAIPLVATLIAHALHERTTALREIVAVFTHALSGCGKIAFVFTAILVYVGATCFTPLCVSLLHGVELIFTRTTQFTLVLFQAGMHGTHVAALHIRAKFLNVIPTGASIGTAGPSGAGLTEQG